MDGFYAPAVAAAPVVCVQADGAARRAQARADVEEGGGGRGREVPAFAQAGSSAVCPAGQVAGMGTGVAGRGGARHRGQPL